MSFLFFSIDILVFPLDVQLALQRLKMVFEKLKVDNLKLSPKKCNFMRSSVKLLGYIVNKDDIFTDPEMVRAITNLCEKDLMHESGNTPSPLKIRSFLGIVGFCQQFLRATLTLISLF